MCAHACEYMLIVFGDMHVYARLCICIFVLMCVDVHVCAYVHVCLSVWVNICACTCVYVCVFIMRVWGCACMCEYACVCVACHALLESSRGKGPMS